ncbi:class I adenylate-forming enzyme family protein [Tropicimonas sp. S265A]|uniref:class I adenylate-forming enzyme family protein n=1 Tax=Tropicimonas sp. S265A TaxID=3415134 RepID=UPI003C7B5766
MDGIYDIGLPEPVPEPFNMAAYVLQRATERGPAPALELHGADTPKTWSFSEILASVQEVAAGLRDTGLTPGDIVLMRLGNTVEFPLVFLAALWAGYVPVPTSAALTQAETDWIARGLAPRLCIGHAPLALPGGVPCLRPEDLHTGGQMDAPHLGDANRLGYVIYTSGSSGTPRAVAHAHRAIWARRMMYQGWYGLTGIDRVFHAGAFNWTYTLGVGLMDPWALGATALIRAEGVANAELPDVLARSNASVFAAAPGVYRQILKSDAKIDLPHLRHALSAGEALPASVRAAWHARTGTEIYEALGMSECSTYISAHPRRQAPPGVAGFAQAGRRLAVLDSNGQPQPFGTPGTLGIHRRDPGLMLGYLGDEAATRARMKGDWFDTGDRATLAADGTVRYLGRDDDMMNAGGYRVAPLEVEAAFARLPAMSECAATEVAIKADAKVIALFYTAAAPIPEADLKAHAETHLARYKQPRLYLYQTNLPRNANGKLNRKALRAGFEAPL